MTELPPSPSPTKIDNISNIARGLYYHIKTHIAIDDQSVSITSFSPSIDPLQALASLPPKFYHEDEACSSLTSYLYNLTVVVYPFEERFHLSFPILLISVGSVTFVLFWFKSIFV